MPHDTSLPGHHHSQAGPLGPRGRNLHKALTDLGFTEVSGVSFGRVITVTLDAADDDLMDRIHDMCTKLLANPVIEDYTVEEIS